MRAKDLTFVAVPAGLLLVLSGGLLLAFGEPRHQPSPAGRAVAAAPADPAPADLDAARFRVDLADGQMTLVPTPVPAVPSASAKPGDQPAPTAGSQALKLKLSVADPAESAGPGEWTIDVPADLRHLDVTVTVAESDSSIPAA